MVKTTTIQKNCTELLNRLPQTVSNYALYQTKGKKFSNSLYRTLVEIERFLNYYAKNLDKPTIDLTNSDFELLSVTTIQEYFLSLTQYKASNKRVILSSLSSFWNYCTIYSYSKDKGKPLFYRHAFDEWKMAYNEEYMAIKEGRIASKKTTEYSVKTTQTHFYSQEEMLEFLDYYDNSFILYLETPKKVENFKKIKDRNLAVIGLFVGTGMTAKEISQLSIRDIDMRKKKVTLHRDNGTTDTISILDFAVPYITPYIKYRRQWFVADRSIPNLFVDRKMRPVGVTALTNVLAQLGKQLGKEITAKNLRASHGELLLKKTNSIKYVKKVHGLSTITAISKYIS